MLLSRFWYVVMAVLLGALGFGLFLATGMYDRATLRAMGESLAGDSQVVSSYLRDDARRRSIALMVPAFDEDLRSALVKSNGSAEKIAPDVKDKARTALRKQFNAVPADLRFDSMFAVDQAGRVVAQVGFDQAAGIEGFELGGYPVVADALHGWIRDDTWVLGGRIYRVVARPVEHDVAAMPAGAIIGARALDDSFARELSRRTGAAVGFYANGSRVSSGAPESFDTGRLDTITGDIKGLDGDKTYRERGYSDVRTIQDEMGVVYARLIGEAWDVGAGYAVARITHPVASPLGFLQRADDKDKHAVPVWIWIVALLSAAVGIGASYFEHTLPLRQFRGEAAKYAKGEVDQLVPSRFRGVYREIASNVNDGADKIASKGGVTRRAADLEQVLGPMPAKPAMSAFSLPQSEAALPPSDPGSQGAASRKMAPPVPPSARATGPAMPGPVPLAPPPVQPIAGPPVPPAAAVSQPRPPVPPVPAAGAPAGPPAPRPAPPVPARPAVPAKTEVVPGAAAPTAAMATATAPADMDDEDATKVSPPPAEMMSVAGTALPYEDEAVEWRQVFEDFLRVKRECAEPAGNLDFEKFKNTLRKNRDQLLQRHGCKRVKFSVYVKDGKAALKASPMKD